MLIISAIRNLWAWSTTPPGLLVLAVLFVVVLAAVAVTLVAAERRRRTALAAEAEAEAEDAARCCPQHLDQPDGEPPAYPAEWLGEGWVIAACCDPDDCGPCCPECPTCPTLRGLNKPADLP